MHSVTSCRECTFVTCGHPLINGLTIPLSTSQIYVDFELRVIGNMIANNISTWTDERHFHRLPHVLPAHNIPHIHGMSHVQIRIVAVETK